MHTLLQIYRQQGKQPAKLKIAYQLKLSDFYILIKESELSNSLQIRVGLYQFIFIQSQLILVMTVLIVHDIVPTTFVDFICEILGAGDSLGHLSQVTTTEIQVPILDKEIILKSRGR